MFSRRPFVLLVLSLLAAAPQGLRAQQCENYHTISVAPVANPLTVTANSTNNAGQFLVTDTAPVEGEDCQGVFPLTVTATGVTVDNWGPTTLWLWRGESDTVNVIFSAGAAGSGSVTLARTGYESTQYGTFEVTVVAAQGPQIVLADHQSARGVSNFDAVATYSTPPYYSADTPHSVQFLYRSSLARPMGFVSVRAWDTTAVYPTKMSVQLKRPDGSYETFANDSTEFFFACTPTGGYYPCNSATNRLAVQFDASTKATGAYGYSLIVRSHRSGGTFVESTAKIRVLIQNEASSPFGAGWTIAGYQRIHVLGDSVIITDGNGSMGFFPRDSTPCWPCTYTAPAGDFSTLTLGSIDSGAVYRRRYPDGTTVGFHSNGRMLWVRDAHGGTTWYRHDNPPALLRSIEDVAGKSDTLWYDANGKVSWVVDPGGRAKFITVDGSGNLTQIAEYPGWGEYWDWVQPFRGTYDGLHRLTQVIDRRGGTRGIAYDFAGKLKADTAPAITTVHGSGERPVVRFVSLETALLSDTALHLGSSTNPAPAANDATVRAKVTSARGFTTSYALNLYGQPLRVEQPQGRVASFQYDAAGRRTRDSLPEGQGHVILRTWSGPNVTQQKDSTTGRTINYAYDATLNLMTLRWGDVDSLVNGLSSDKKAIDSTRVGGATEWTRFSYGAAPSWHLQCTSKGVTISAYGASCRYLSTSGFKNSDSGVVRMFPPTTPQPTSVTRYTHDAYGRTIRTVSPVGDTSWTQYDALNRVTRSIGPQKDTTSYTYDSLYLTQVLDARGQVYTVWPNALGSPDSTADPAGRVTRFTYDSAGNQVAIVNRRGQTIQFTYDSLDQVRLRIVGTDTTKYFTDPLGRYTAIANRESVDTFNVDSAGRPWVRIACRITGSPYQCFRDSSAYEIRDLRTQLTVTAPVAPAAWSHTAAYHYNAHMQLDTLTNFSYEKQAFTYGGARQDSTRKYLALNNLTLTYGRHPFSPWSQGSASLTFSDAALNQSIGLAYGYDTLSRVARHYHGKLAGPDTVRSAIYSAGRLVTYADTAHTWLSDACSLWRLGEKCDYGQVDSLSPVGAPVSFSYDSLGNRKDSPSQAYAVDPGNRLRRLGYVRMDYDLDGNLIRKRTLNPADTSQALRTDSLFWNALGQLDSMRYTGGGGARVRVHFGYDGRGRLVRKWFPAFAGSLTRYLYDGDQLVFQVDSVGYRKAYWTWYPGTDEIQSVAVTTCCSGDTTLYNVTDALRNVVARVKSTGGGGYALYTQYRYGPYGDSLGISGSNKWGVVQFKGAYWEPGPRLYRMGARYYDPDVGRFISEDPLGFEAGINQYAFAGGDPVNGYDPSGTINVVKLLQAIGPILAVATTFAFLPGSAPAAFLATVKSMAATAVGAAISGGVESLSNGEPFLGAFYRNFSISSWFQAGTTVIAMARGGGLTGAGVNHHIQGTISSKTEVRGFTGVTGVTWGSAAALWGPEKPLLHELGHTIQFIGLSAFTPLTKKFLPFGLGPWLPYWALGAGQFIFGSGFFWETNATWLGEHVGTHIP